MATYDWLGQMEKEGCRGCIIYSINSAVSVFELASKTVCDNTLGI